MSLRKIIRAIRKHKTFFISSHVNPDTDALTSMLALSLALKKMGKKVKAVHGQPVPKMYRFLSGSHLIEPYRGKDIEYDAAIILDCGSSDRIGRPAQALKRGKPLINIDHHITSDYFGSINLVDAKASSTAELVFNLLKKMGFKINKQIAELLYLGIMTDTGSFRYDNTTARTHIIVSELLKYRLSVNKLYSRVYENIPLHDLGLFIKIMNRMEISHRARAASLVLNKKELKRISGQFDIKEKIFNLLRSIRGIEAVMIFTEIQKNLTRVNFRSQNKVDVARLALAFGGGGHRKASGCVLKQNTALAKKTIHRALAKMLK